MPSAPAHASANYLPVAIGGDPAYSHHIADPSKGRFYHPIIVLLPVGISWVMSLRQQSAPNWQIDSKFIQKVKKAGYSHPSPDELINFKILGIRVNEKEI